MADIFRDSAVGQIIRYATKNRYLQYPEEKPGFELPQAYADILKGSSTGAEKIPTSRSSTSLDDDNTVSDGDETTPVQHIQSHRDGINSITEGALEADEIHRLEKTQSIPIAPRRTKDGAILVDWYFTDDPEDPHNWSNNKRNTIALIICLYTFVVYTTSAIYTASTEGVIEELNVSLLKATLGLSIYVLGYGTGPLIFSPLSEIPSIGRNPVYMVTMFLFVILSIPTAFVQNYAGLMVLRFLQGFFGSPCLASGGASLGDMYSLMAIPYAMMAWVSAAYCGRKLVYFYFLPLFLSACLLLVLIFFCSCSWPSP